MKCWKPLNQFRYFPVIIINLAQTWTWITANKRNYQEEKNSGQVIISILISIFNSNTSLIVFHLYIFFSSVYYSSFFNLIFYLENEWTEARVSWHAVPLHGQLGAALQSLSRCRSKLTLSSSFALQQPFGIYLLSHAVDFVDSEHENSSGTLLKCLFGLQTVCPRRTGSLGASIPNNLQ